MKALILTNAYVNTGDIAYQPDRLKEEFEKMGVATDIRPNNFFPVMINNGEIENLVADYDFCVFLDKDKYALKGLEKSGMKIYNAYEPITVCDDKMLTYLALAGNGIPIPKTLPAPLCFDKNATVKKEMVDGIIQKLELPVIVKECFGSLGKGVYLAKTKDELFTLCQELKDKPHLFQEFISSSYGKDIRIIVIGGQVVGAIMRVSNEDFRSNISSGGHGELFEPTEEMKNLAVKISKVLNLDYCGMDFLIDSDGSPTVCEVNSNAFFKGFENVTKINVAKKYAEFILNDIKKNSIIDL